MKKFNLTVIVAFSSLAVQAQSLSPEVHSSAGNSFSNSSGQLDWTLGETVTSTLNAPGTTATQGFHQPDLSITTMLAENESIVVSLYPNPVVSSLQVSLTNPVVATKLELFTAEGKVVLSKEINAAQTELSMTDLSSGTYLLKISSAGNKSNTYRIIKSK
jgi:hypothetical protein